jgi:TonB-dependent starch-binding outer membrane protein SusC
MTSNNHITKNLLRMINRYLTKRLFLMLSLFVPVLLAAQNATLRGNIQDEAGEPLLGVTVFLEGTTIGAITDFDGNYTVESITPGTYNVQISFVGFKKETTTMTFAAGETKTLSLTLFEDVNILEEAVVIGYGTTQTKDLTGSVVAVSTKDFQKGNFATPEQLVVGKVAGVQITSNSGQPGAGSRIRIRGGTSLNASNDPLIVIDGVPVDNGGISGASNPLSLLNPDDIETFTVLKDASAAAIYGSRAANGVIIITTKKGAASSKLNVGFSTNNSISQIVNYVDVLGAQQFRDTVLAHGNATQINLLGESETDWQREIYQVGFATDNNLSLSGGVKNLPYRLGLEFNHTEGILKTSEMDRVGATLNLSPNLINNHLKVDVNAKYYNVQNVFANTGAIGSAVTFDPTQSVTSGTDEFGGYFEWVSGNGNPNALAPRNPLGLLMQRQDESSVNRFIGNVMLDYTTHFMEDLHLIVNVGGDFANSNGTVFVPAEAASDFLRGGVNNKYEQTKVNRVLDTYFNYKTDLRALKSTVDLTGGYSFQYWSTESPEQPNLNVAGDTITPPGLPFFTDNALMSFYGRLNYNLAEKYILTATLRNDGSSRFSPDTRWGLFPSVAFAWRLSEESLFKDIQSLSFLKLRVGWGITGQQDIFSDYPYIANYAEGTSTAQYQFGDVFYTVLRPDGYDPNIKWEETTSINVGLDFGFNNNRWNGAIDVYRKTTEDLLSIIPIPAGTNFTNQLLTNVGSMLNTGMEISLNYVAIDNENMTLEFGGNATFNRNEITKLNVLENEDDPGILVGGISGGVGNTIQIHSVGFPVFTFYTYEQVYAEDGSPIEGEYVDQNGDGVINPDDIVRFDGNPAPNLFIGFFSNFNYKKWTAGFSLRGEFGQYVYNNVNSSLGNYFNVGSTKGYLANMTSDYVNTVFQTPQYLTDYYLESASYLRLDNLYLGYNFGNIIADQVGLSATFIIQNALVISSYSGIDPEVGGGIDNNFYPRPRTYGVNLNFNF